LLQSITGVSAQQPFAVVVNEEIQVNEKDRKFRLRFAQHDSSNGLPQK
jgi:hypothetical protein